MHNHDGRKTSSVDCYGKKQSGDINWAIVVCKMFEKKSFTIYFNEKVFSATAIQ